MIFFFFLLGPGTHRLPFPSLPSHYSLLFRNHAVLRASVGCAPFSWQETEVFNLHSIHHRHSHMRKKLLGINYFKGQVNLIISFSCGGPRLSLKYLFFFFFFYKNCFLTNGVVEITALKAWF